jgi:hypothetical protein
LFGGELFADKIVEMSGSKDAASGTVYISGWAASGKIAFAPFKANTQYTFIIKASVANAGNPCLAIFYTDGTKDVLPYITDANTPTIVTKTSASGKTVESLSGGWYSDTTFYYNECGIFQGVLSASDFKPYKEYPPLPIPQAVQNLPDWGVGYNASNYNHIVWKPGEGIKKYVQNCYRAVINGSEYGQFETTGMGGTYANTYIVGVNIASNYKAGRSLYGVADLYDRIENTELGKTKGIMTGYFTGYFYITDPDFTDLATAKAKLAANPVHICFYSDTVKETDISDILTDDNFIEVEAGGVVIPENEDKLAAPLQVVYQVK